jgi:1-acyl-sn-glycerol-3-phosphate acyltransferase
MLDVLNRLKGKIVHFPEGGRTCTGKDLLRSRRGKLMRHLGVSTGWLALKTQAPVWPIWLEHGEVKPQLGKKLFSWPRFGREPITIVFGKLMRMDEGLMSKSPAEFTEVVATNLLNLADQA